MNNITPIFIIGSARNGTTNLENSIAAFPQVAGVEHWLHYGSHESNLYRNRKYWGDLTEVRDYVDFLYQYSSSDYFSLCNGDIDYHLNRHRDNFYSFFFDLMDRYARIEKKEFWITKMDPHFFFDNKERKLFFRLLNNRYKKIKYIRIKRNFEDTFKSYVNMEGKSHRMRQHTILMLPALALQTSRYILTYENKIQEFREDIFEIPFEDYIGNRREYIGKIENYLNISIKNYEELELDRYQVNTSFVNRSKKIPGIIIALIPFLKKVYMVYPILAKLIWKGYYYSKREANPTFHRILNYKFFREKLIQDLSKKNATGILEKIKDVESATRD